jgi:3-methylcrotonyl-CoA carboxylase alpha subunit
VEFLLDSDGSFYFMEMNTRLQVEHPVTEMITGEDLVEWQIHVANDLPLPKTQDELSLNGHAFEARVYAEDPDNDFLPQTGLLSYLKPPRGESIRVDTGVEQGDEVSIYYDPMIAKLIVHGKDRQQALSKLISALRDYHIVGVTTNIEYLLRVAQSDAFTMADLTTDFVERHADSLVSENAEIEPHMQALAAFILLQTESKLSNTAFADFAGFRLNHRQKKQLSFSHKDKDCVSEATRIDQNTWSIQTAEDTLLVTGLVNSSSEANGAKVYQASVQVDVLQIQVSAIIHGSTLTLFTNDNQLNISLPEADYSSDDHGSSAGGILAPMNGTLVSMLVKAGDTVQKGDSIAIVEAMKMEHALKAPFDARVVECFFAAGERVDGGAILLELAKIEDE